MLFLKTLSPKVKGDERLLWIRQQLDAALLDVSFAAMESYSYDSVNKAFTLGEVGGTVKVLFLERAVKYITVPPVLVKMFATGLSHAVKTDMVIAAQATGACPANDNEADAFFLAQIARAYFLGTAKKRQEMEVIHRLRTSASGKQDKPKRRQRRLLKAAV